MAVGDFFIPHLGHLVGDAAGMLPPEEIERTEARKNDNNDTDPEWHGHWILLEFRESEQAPDYGKDNDNHEPCLGEGYLNHYGTRVGHCQLNGSSP